jgi:hypothetical protein
LFVNKLKIGECDANVRYINQIIKHLSFPSFPHIQKMVKKSGFKVPSAGFLNRLKKLYFSLKKGNFDPHAAKAQIKNYGI